MRSDGCGCVDGENGENEMERVGCRLCSNRSSYKSGILLTLSLSGIGASVESG